MFDWRRRCRKEGQSNDRENLKSMTDDWGSSSGSGTTTSKVNFFHLLSESSKDNIFSLGWTSETGCFSQDVQMHHTTRASQRPNGRESYDVQVFEAQEQKYDDKSDHTDMEVRKKWDWCAITKQMKKKISHLHISNAYGKLNKTAKSSRGTLCVPFFFDKKFI